MGSVLAIVALTVGGAGRFSAIDLLGGGEQTHLARALASAGQGGPRAVGDRRAQGRDQPPCPDLDELVVDPGRHARLPGLRPLPARRRLRGSCRREPVLHRSDRRYAGRPAALALLTEDSGIVIPSLIMLYTGIGLAWLVLARLAKRRLRGDLVSEATAYAVTLVLRCLRALRSSRGWRCARSSRLWRHRGADSPRTTEAAGSWSGSALVWLVWVLGLMVVALIDVAVRRTALGGGGADLREFARRTAAVPARARHLRARHGRRLIWARSADKGFRGHLSALRHGRLTTGALKLLGIGVLAPFSIAPDFGCGRRPLWATSGLWVLQVLAIALTANLLNLMDLRPGTGAQVLLVAGRRGVRPHRRLIGLVRSCRSSWSDLRSARSSRCGVST